MDRPLSSRLALAAYEDAMALASVAEGQGFATDAEAMRKFAAKVRPMPSRLCGRDRRETAVSA